MVYSMRNSLDIAMRLRELRMCLRELRMCLRELRMNNCVSAHERHSSGQ